MRRVVLALPLAVLVAACVPSVRPPSPTVAVAAGVTVPADRLRIEAIEASRRMAARIERTAEAIQDSTDDQAIWRHAQHWKVNGTLAVQDAAVRFEPLVSLLDLYALSVQQEEFFAQPPGDTLFGPFQAQVQGMTRGSRRELHEFLLSILPADREGRLLDSLDAWARRHPLTTAQFARYTIEGYAAQLINVDETSMFAAVGSMEQTVRTLDSRMALLQQSMAKQVRWQAELLGHEMLPPADRDSLVSHMGTAVRSLADVAATMDAVPGLVTSERIAVLEALGRERQLVMAGLASERLAITAALANGRDSILQAVDSQRRAFLRDAEEATLRIKAATFAELDRSIDRAIRKAALFLVLPILLGIGLLILALAWILRPRAP